MFDPAVHTLAAYQQAAESFFREHGFTPLDAAIAPEGLPADVLAQAQFLNSWDVWLFTQ